MTKAKISQYDAVAGNNTDVNGVNIAEGCPPSSMNNMGREIMAALKRYQVGSDGDGVTVGGNLVVSGSTTANTFTVGAVSATTLNTSGQVVFNDAGADVDFRVEGDTDANLFFVDASTDRVGIGTSSPAALLTVSGASGASRGQLTVIGASTANPRVTFYRDSTFAGDISCTNAQMYISAMEAVPLVFSTSDTERMRITSAGNVGIGTTSPDAKIRADDTANQTILAGINSNASFTAAGLFLQISRNTTNNTFFAIDYYNLGANAYKFRVADSGNVTNTNNSYGSISDVKLKQDIVDANSQWDDIKNLRVRKFHWKSDPDGFMQLGLVAQEAELVSPGLIDEHPDYENVEVPVLDDDGNPVLDEDGTPQVTKERNALGTTTKAIKYSVLYMKAVKALQEAMERIETLEAKVAALEAQ